MSIDENGILNTYLNLSEFNKQLLSVSIAEAMKPLVYHLKCTELNCLYDYYHMYKKNSIGHKLESILEQVSKRKFEYSGISMLNGIIELCNESNSSKELVQNYIDSYTINFGSVLNFDVDSEVIS